MKLLWVFLLLGVAVIEITASKNSDDFNNIRENKPTSDIFARTTRNSNLREILTLQSSRLTRDTSTLRVLEPADMPSYNYCTIKDPTHQHTFDFSTLSDFANDKKIRLDKYSLFRIHFCRPLVKPCNGMYGYSVCYVRNGTEIGIGREPPRVNQSFGKVMFRYSGDRCNATHNYTLDFEMKCNYLMKKEVAIDIDVMNLTEDCNFHVALETAAACTKRSQGECTATDKNNTERYNLNPLIDYTKNYEVQISDDMSVIMNICHSVLYGPHHANCSSDTSICLIDRTNKTNIRYKSIGKFEAKPYIYVVDKHLLINYDSDILCYQRHIEQFQKVKTTIKFICDLNATDTLPEYIGGMDICHYKFIWRTIAACSESVLRDQSLVNRDFCSVKDPITQYEYDLSSFKDRPFKTRTMDGIYEISICGFLNETTCKVGSGVCRISEDGKQIGISGGIANGKLMWKESGPYLNYTDGNICAKGLRKYTVISFLCAEADWIDIEDKACHTDINWYTKSICKKPCAMSLYDMNFEKLIKSKGNYIVKTNSSTVFHLNVCRPLVNGRQFKNCSNGAGICKADIDKDGKSTNEVNLGYPDQNLHGRSDGTVTLTYKNGALCKEDNEQRTMSEIKFVCDLDHAEGAPRYVDYHNCTYHFEWRTKLSCGKVKGDLTDECQLTNVHGDIWDLSELSKQDFYEFKMQRKDRNHTFNLSICGGKKVCGDSHVCDEKMSYGRNMTITSDYRTNMIQVHFTGGDRCSDGSYAQAILNIKCNESAIISEPVVYSDQYCKAEFEWSTHAICRPENLLHPTSKNQPNNQKNSTSHGTTRPKPGSSSTVEIVFLILFLLFIISIVIYYFHKTSRRTLCMMYIHNLFRRCPFSREYPQPVGNLCL